MSGKSSTKATAYHCLSHDIVGEGGGAEGAGAVACDAIGSVVAEEK